MYIKKIAIENFRLLRSVELCLEQGTTVIVGRNNCGKTSLTELFRRLLKEKSPCFKFEDFSIGVFEEFWKAFELKQADALEEEIRNALPVIKVVLTVDYRDNVESLGPLSDFVIDLDLECTEAQVNIYYALEKGKIETLFEDVIPEKMPFFKCMKERVPAFYKIFVEAQDPNDSTNRKSIEYSKLQSLFEGGFINAQRALDDASHAEKAVLGKIIEALFLAASSENESKETRNTAKDLESAVADIQERIDEDFNAQLCNLVPALERFGYPGFSDRELRTETILKVEQLLSNHTTVGYEVENGINLPESYNGLGSRNLIFILLKLLEFFRSYMTTRPASGSHVVFIEEPEAHLHPQMQSVFIRKLGEIADWFSMEYNDGERWPVQFIVTTHSSHIANEADFSSMRYFLAQPEDQSTVFHTIVKDLRSGLSADLEHNNEFLHKYMTLTKCDLLFADKAILIEGPTERLLLPKMIEKIDFGQPEEMKLSSQYLSVMEVGGAYAQIFFNLLDFLKLKTLIITDLDIVKRDEISKKWIKCKVSEGTRSSNPCINRWFAWDRKGCSTRDHLLNKNDDEKVVKARRLAFQVPHSQGDACGRTFEDAFILANSGIFDVTDDSPEDREAQAWEKAKKISKTDFALKYAIKELEWVVPRYIEEGLRWLAENSAITTVQEVEETTACAEPILREGEDD